MLLAAACLLFANFAGAEDLSAAELYWNKHGVYYQIFVRAFADGDGDGLGDLQGLLNSLDYLEDLGVSGIWLTPIHPSPSYHKYDVTDYYGVDREIGTLDDFHRLIKEAHRRGLKIILDLVLNHTSKDHPWFAQAALNPQSPFREYYIWATPDTNVKQLGPWGQRVWHPLGSAHYYGLFWEGMPDLNYDSSAVRAEAKEIARFWLKQGVDGFRLDAAPHIFAHSQPERALQWWQEFQADLRTIKPDVYLVAEVWDSSHLVAPYFSGFDSCFNFDLANLIILSAKSGLDVGLAQVASGHQARFQEYSPWAVDAPFLTNHDQDRVMSLLNDVGKAKIAASLYLTLPGNPFIYYGEEIGMKGAGADENKREPFKWYALDGPGQTSWRSIRFNQGEWEPSVWEQRLDPDSLWSHYRRLIHLRQDKAALRLGSLQPLSTENRRVVGFTREWEGQKVLVFHNLAAEGQQVEIELGRAGLREIYSDGESTWELIGQVLQVLLSPRSSLFLELVEE